MGINLLDICYAIQFNISDYIILPELLQRLKCGGRDASCLAVVIVFVKTQQILPNNIHTLKRSTLKDLQISITFENWNQAMEVILRLYCEHIQSKVEKIENLS